MMQSNSQMYSNCYKNGGVISLQVIQGGEGEDRKCSNTFTLECEPQESRGTVEARYNLFRSLFFHDGENQKYSHPGNLVYWP